ncbi:hypothetical protein QQ008_05645 [Fulvivirgaceae bacterium BMA10]|uniref:Uncharacterized protein n=1 Tax=Splendidivirga corallicola TaxID=3051826 RepID=A0ABT8KJE5_9BACT|nr:hypothetical protein [Fulvivirgaceae bacterium BMA10]
MKKLNKTLGIVILTLLAFNTGFGQDTEENVISRDIKVVEGILDQIFDGNRDHLFGSDRTKGNYIPGFGVIFKVPISITARGELLIFPGNEDETDQVEETTLNVKNEETYRNKLKVFFEKYADLLTHLNDNDKILVIVDNLSAGSYQVFLNRLDRRGRNVTRMEDNFQKLMAQASFKDVKDYRTNKLSKSQFESKISFSKNVDKNEVDEEYEILAGIFDNLFKSDAELNFNFKRNSTFERLNGFGVIYYVGLQENYFAVGYSTQSQLGYTNQTRAIGRAITTQKSDAKEEKPDKSYLKLEEKLKTYMVQYGKTLRSLGNNEVLMVTANLPNCYDCSSPQKIDLILDASILRDFDQGKMPLDKAVSLIKVRRQARK